MTKRRVVVTGLGIVSPVGIGVAQAWQNIVAGKSGITRITRFDPSAFACQVAGEVKRPDATGQRVFYTLSLDADVSEA